MQSKNKNIKFQIVCPTGTMYEYPKDISVDHSLVDMEQDFLTPKIIYENFSKLKKYEENADLIWMIDRTFPINSKKPKLLSLNTLCYERELMSIFQSNWDKMVVLTDFVKRQVEDYVNKSELYEIPCYVDPIFLNFEKNTKVLDKYFKYNPKYKYILFPHRPDPAKGHITAIDILKELIKNDSSYRLLIPLPPLAKQINVDRENESILQIKKYVSSQKLEDYVIFHKWIDYEDLPIYYYIGEYTLFLSKLPETFGLTLLNSISVGTPVISYGVGALNEVVPTGNAHFNINTIEDAVKIISKGKNKCNIKGDKNYVCEKYNLNNISQSYIELFEKLKEEK